MSIQFHEESNTFILDTRDTSYRMQISRYGNLLHLYYGRRICDVSLDYLLRFQDRGFSPNPNEAGNDRTFSLDFLPQEFSTDGKGDYRSPSIEVENGDGSFIFSGKVTGHRIYRGKYRLEGMPSLRAAEGDTVDSLEIRLEDAESGAALGTLMQVLPYPAHDVYVIRGEKEFMVPAVPAFIQEINLEKETIQIHVWEGLL